jgi:hypothetical protein
MQTREHKALHAARIMKGDNYLVKELFHTYAEVLS